MPRPVHRTHITKAVLRLRELILNGAFRPGERMSELPLVERLGISRTPLRLALAQLEHEGLLRGLPGGGYVVREFTQADVRDAIELRGVLEGTAARFAAERGVTARDLDALRTTNETISRYVRRADYESFERFLELNEAFHARLLQTARSSLLARALQGVLALPFAAPSALVLAHAELPASRDVLVVAHRQHVDLIDAIERRQGARAESLAREHARLALANLDLVVAHREIRDKLPGAALISLSELPEADPKPEPSPAAAAAATASASRDAQAAPARSGGGEAGR